MSMVDKLVGSGSIGVIIGGLLAAGLGAPIPEDPLIVAGGVIAHRGDHAWWVLLPTFLVCAIVADSGLFALGWKFGPTLLDRRPFRWLVTPSRRVKVQRLFEEKGPYAVFLGRHMSGLRTVVFLFAGSQRMDFRRFILWDTLAAAISLPLVFAMGYFFSSHIDAVMRGVDRTEHWIGFAVAIAALCGWAVWSHRKNKSLGKPRR
ncbi:MAG: DedA family protein [bacterium]